jgi:copper homeostasis protein
MQLELACFNLESSRIAAAVGVHRLELCEDYTCGGLTPSMEYFREARKVFPNDIFVMIRPRAGDYIFSDAEFNLMLQDVEKFKAAGANGFVSGFFTPSGAINEEQLKRFVEACHPLPVTFHRSFDLLPDWKSGLDLLIQHGCTRLLTSGDGPTAYDGRMRLKEMMDHAGTKLLILPGGGIRSSNIREIIHTCHPAEVHSAALSSTAVHDNNYTADEDELQLLLSKFQTGTCITEL